MTVSFIVTSYNYADFITETINSIKNQTYKDFEIIVVDDYSTDNSVEILEHIDNIKLIKHNTNQGQLSAIQTGLRQANGEYICIIDSDDSIEPDYTKTLLDYLTNNNVSLVTCNSKEETILTPKTHPFGGWYWQPMSCGMFKRNSIEIILNYKHFNLWKICPDKLLFNIAHLQGNSMTITEKLVNKREHKKNAGKTKYRFLINLRNNLLIRHEVYRLITDKEQKQHIIKSHTHLLKQIITFCNKKKQ